MSARRICVVTSGHLSTCPRMLRAADALSSAGFAVRVVSLLSIPWATEHDHAIAATRPWTWSPVDVRRSRHPLTHARVAARRRLLRAICKRLPARLPFRLASTALTRGGRELIRAATASPADLVYAGTVGGLAVGPLAATRLGVGYALDLEDQYAADCPDDEEGHLDQALIQAIEGRVLQGARFRTAGSAAIADAYAASGHPAIPIHNVLARPVQRPAPLARRAGGRRLLWFSQTIGPGRGLEDVVAALGLLNLPAELHLLGNPAGSYLEELTALARRTSPHLRVVHHPPVHPDDLPRLAREYDIGLSLERLEPVSRARCLTNKALTCIAAGLAVALTDTPGHRQLASDLGPGALVFPPGDPAAAASRLRPWLTDDDALTLAREAAWEAAARRWHWEHPLERGALLDAVERAL